MTIFHDPSFYYNDLTRSITDAITSSLNNGISSASSFAMWDYPIFIDAEDDIIEWRYNVHFADNVGDRHFDVWASAGFNEHHIPEVEFTIVLPENVILKDCVIDKSELSGAVAHELHHIAQKNEGFCEYQGDSTNPQVRYYLNSIEVPAFHMGFRAQCSCTGEDMEEAMRSYLSGQTVNDEEIELIINAWLYPNFEIALTNLIG
tara:strand:+ start:96 stop:707 length:612 start_codon:yes stop_codon:yes gene_type:complete